MLRTEVRTSPTPGIEHETVVWDDATGDWEILEYAAGSRLVRLRRCVYRFDQRGIPVGADVQTVSFDEHGREVTRETRQRPVTLDSGGWAET